MFRIAAAIVVVFLVSLVRFEYIIGTHLFFRPNTGNTHAEGYAGAARVPSGGMLPGGGGFLAENEEGGGGGIHGDGGGIRSGVGGSYSHCYNYFGKATKKIVFRPVVLNPKK